MLPRNGKVLKKQPDLVNPAVAWPTHLDTHRGVLRTRGGRRSLRGRLGLATGDWRRLTFRRNGETPTAPVRQAGRARNSSNRRDEDLGEPTGRSAEGASEAKARASKCEQSTRHSSGNECCFDLAVYAGLISRSYVARKCLSRTACAETLILHPQCRRDSRKKSRHPSGAVGYPFLRHRQST